MSHTENHNEYRSVPLILLEESPTNPRRRFNEQTLNELASSLKTQGMLAPLVVRPLDNDKFEVVAGARRLRAARIAQLETVPVRIVPLSDAAAIEAQVVENLQREDIHPLEEANSFRLLLDLKQPEYTLATIAAKAGKSEAYVQGRIKLSELVAPIAEAFLADRITIGHALLIAKLPASQQQEAFNAAFRQMWTSAGNQQVLIPVRELQAWIESNILLELAAAPFSKDDEQLLPEAGSCIACPKRTGVNALLFSDVRKDSCTDPQCFRAKVDAHVAKNLAAKPKIVQISSAWQSRAGAPLGRNRYVEIEVKRPKANGKAEKHPPTAKPCEKMAEAIVMDGGQRGQIIKVCADPACRIHHADRPSPQQLQREREDERKRVEKEKRALSVRHRILAAILQRVSAPLNKADVALIARSFVSHLPAREQAMLAKRHKVTNTPTTSVEAAFIKSINSCDETALCRLLLETSLLDAAYQRGGKGQDDPLLESAKRYRIDTAKIEKTVTEQATAKQEKGQSRKTAAKKKAA